MPKPPPKVLVIEDEPEIVYLLRLLFRLWGWETVASAFQGEATAILANSHFDLILLDLMLPDGNGIDILRALRSHPGSPPVIVSTANDAPLVMAAVNALAPDCVLVKPVDVAKMQLFVDRIKAAYEAGPP